MTIATKPTSDRKEEEEAAKQPAFDAVGFTDFSSVSILETEVEI